jgi:hypothetical protein
MVRKPAVGRVKKPAPAVKPYTNAVARDGEWFWPLKGTWEGTYMLLRFARGQMPAEPNGAAEEANQLIEELAQKVEEILRGAH